jgi:hypothetical protein
MQGLPANFTNPAKSTTSLFPQHETHRITESVKLWSLKRLLRHLDLSLL